MNLRRLNESPNAVYAGAGILAPVMAPGPVLPDGADRKDSDSPGPTDNFAMPAPDTRAYRLARAQEALGRARYHERMIDKDPGRRNYHTQEATRLRAISAALEREPTVVQTEASMHYAYVPHPGRMSTPHEDALAHIHGGAYGGVQHVGAHKFHSYGFKSKAGAANFAAAHHKHFASGAKVEESSTPPEPPVQLSERTAPVITHTNGLRDTVREAIWRSLGRSITDLSVTRIEPNHATYVAYLTDLDTSPLSEDQQIAQVRNLLSRSGSNRYAFTAEFSRIDGVPVIQGTCRGIRVGAVIEYHHDLVADAIRCLSR